MPAADRGHGTGDEYTCRTKITVSRSVSARSWKMGTNWSQALFPSLKRRGGCAIKKISRSNLSSLGEILRPEEFRRTDHPVCGASEASRYFIDAADTPPFQGGEFVCQFIRGY